MTTSIGRRSDGSLVLLDTQEVQLCSVEFLAKIVAMHNEKLGDLKRERALADRLADASKAVVSRWETPHWKNAPATAEYIYRMRDALAAWKEARK